MGNRRKLSAAQLRQIRELQSAGRSLRQIAKQIGVSAQTVSNYRNSLKKSVGTKQDGYTQPELKELLSFMGPHDDAVSMLADFMVASTEDAKALIAKFGGKERE